MKFEYKRGCTGTGNFIFLTSHKFHVTRDRDAKQNGYVNKPSNSRGSEEGFSL